MSRSATPLEWGQRSGSNPFGGEAWHGGRHAQERKVSRLREDEMAPSRIRVARLATTHVAAGAAVRARRLAASRRDGSDGRGAVASGDAAHRVAARHQGAEPRPASACTRARPGARARLRRLAPRVPGNVTICERFGFHTLSSVEGGDPPTCWIMLRNADGAGTTGPEV